MNCRYINSSESYQVIILLNKGWEKTLTASQSTDFIADPNDFLEIREACNPFTLSIDRIPCIELMVN